MEVNKILNLDFREDKNKKIIQEVLRKIKPLSKVSDEKDIPIEMLEKLCHKITIKYNIEPSLMLISYNQPVLCRYSISVNNSLTKDWIGTVYGMCLYEMFAKLSIKMYSIVNLKK